jgi:high-affinity iron transporter
LDLGELTTGFLIGLREGVEAALIVAIVLAYLVRTGNRNHAGKIWIGMAAAVVASLGLGVGLFVTVGGLRQPYEQLFEAATMLLATAVVTWMLFWMRRQAAGVRGELHSALERVLGTGSAWGLALLAFTAVIREGIETSLFLVGQVTSAQAGGPNVLVGALIGLGTAALIGWAFYTGSHRIDLRFFFRWTGVALVFIAAGLVSHAIHELAEIGLVTVGTATAFDIRAVLPDETGLGEFLRALLGYSANPEIVTLGAYLAYVIVVLGLFLRPSQPASPTRTRAAESASS